MRAFTNGIIFNGTSFVEDHALLDDDGVIKAVVPRSEIPAGIERIDVKGNYIAPAFIDLQLYGGDGMLFADHPSVDSLVKTVEYSMKGGAAYIMPTIPTHRLEIMLQGVAATRDYWKSGGVGVLGMHAEGPFLNPVKRGAHVLEYIQEPTLTNLKSLLENNLDAIRMITIAPELFADDALSYLLDQDVLISAGHSNATYDQAIQFFNRGIPAATHLFNAMSPFAHRAPGLPGAIFDHHRVLASVVADGYHVDFAAIRVAKKLLGERLCLITDAVTNNDRGAYQHRFDGQKYSLQDGTLSGSSLTMLQAVKNAVEQIGIPLEESLRMASLYPARLIKRDHNLGKLEKGYESAFVMLDRHLHLVALNAHKQLRYF